MGNYAYSLKDNTSQQVFSNLTKLAAKLCNTSQSFISIEEDKFEIVKAKYNLDCCKSQLDSSLFDLIEKGNEIFIYSGDTINKTYSYAGDRILFFAAAPLFTNDGTLIGYLNVFDAQPKNLSANQKENLQILAQQAIQLLELQSSRMESVINKADLQDKTDRLHTILEATGVGIWEWNVQSGELLVNERWASILGYTLKELQPFQNDFWNRLVHPEDIHIPEANLKECFIKKSDYYDVEFRMLHKNGSVIWVNDRGRVVERDSDGKPLIMMGTFNNISEKKNTELQLKTIVNNVPAAVFRYQRDVLGHEEIILVSNGAAKIWGYSAEDVMNNNNLVWERFEPGYSQTFKKSFEISAVKLKFWEQEWQYSHPDGTIRWHKGSGNPTIIENGSIVWDCIIQDITESKKIKHDLEKTLIILTDHIKEQECLYEISNLSKKQNTVDSLLTEAVKLIPNGFKYTDIGSAYIKFEGKKYTTTSHKKTKWSQEVDRHSLDEKKLTITFFYLEKRPELDEGPFYKEEVQLLHTIADSLILNINQIEFSEQNELILESTDEGIYGLDSSGYCTFINPAGAKMLGYKVQECLGQNMHKLIHHHHEDGKKYTQKNCPIYFSRNSGKTCRKEDEVYWRKDGSYFPVRYSATPIAVNSQNKGAVVVFNDITDKKEAEKKLSLSEKRYKALVQEGSDLISILDDKGNYIYVSSTSKTILGLSPERLLHKNAFDYIHKEDKAYVFSNFSKLSNEKSIALKPFRFKAKPGKWRWIETILTNLINEPAIGGIVSNSRDVTERENTFRELKASEDRYRGFYESQTNYVIRTDVEGIYSYVNKKFEEDFGWIYSDGKILGKNSLSSIMEYHYEVVAKTVEKTISKPGTVFQVEIDKPAQDGGVVSTLWDFVCIVNSMGVPTEIQCMGIDISKRKIAEKQLIKSNERYDLVNKATNDAIYDWDISNDNFSWGGGFYKLFGHEDGTDNFSFSDRDTLIHPLDRKETSKKWKAFLKDPKALEWLNEYRFQRADGSYAHVREIGNLIRDKQGKPKRMIGVLRDHSITKQDEIKKQLEREITIFFKSPERLSIILKKVLRHIVKFAEYKTAEIWLYSANKNQLKLVSTSDNTKAAKSFYKKTKDLKEVSIGEGLPGIVWEQKIPLLWNSLGDEEKFIRKDAAKESGLESAIGLPLTHNNEFIGTLILSCNMVQNMKDDSFLLIKSLKYFLGAEIKRKQQEEELHLFFESAPEILAIASPQGYFTKVNPAFSQIMGYTAEELTSRPFTEFIHPEDKKTNKKYTSKVPGERMGKNFINRYITKAGQVRWISWNTSEVYGEDSLVYTFGNDITEIKNLQQSLENAAKLARIGSWELDLHDPENTEMYWTPMTREILEVDDSYSPSLTGGFELYQGEYKIRITTAVKKLIATGEKFDLELKITTGKGKEKWIRSIGKSEHVENKCIKIFGSIQDIDQRKVAELELAKTTKQIVTTLESIQDGFYSLDKNWIVTYWNKEAEQLLHTKRKDIIGKNIWDAFKEAIPRKFYSEYHRAVKENKPVRFEEYFPTTDGWYDVSAFPSNNGLTVYFKEITEKKKIEENLKKSLQERNTILESIGDAFFAVDNDWVVTYWNKEAEKILATYKEDIIGKNLWEMFPAALDLKFYTEYNRAAETGIKVQFEEFYPPSQNWFEVSAYPSDKGLSIYFKDINDRKLAEEQLRQFNERFEKITEATNDAIWDYDIVNNKLFTGKGFHTLFGYDKKDYPPTFEALLGLIHPDDRHLVTSKIRQFMSDDFSTHWFEEYRFRKANGNYAFVIDRAIFIRDNQGSIIRVLGAMTDITNRKKQEESLEILNSELKKYTKELEISNAELEQFAYVTSHDLQEPLRMITSFLNQLEKKYSDQLDEKAHKYIYFAVDGAKRMRQIILDLLEFSRVGRFDDIKEEMHLKDIVEDFTYLRQKLIREKKAVIEVVSLPTVFNYRAPLTQVFHNLLDNALKYSKENTAPHITINSLDKGTYWEISIKDNGIGIESDYFKKIFIIFQRLHNKDSYSGTGMGLAIVKKVIENMDENIWLESTPTVGTSFYFTIHK